MPVSLFDGTVARFEQTLSATLGVLEKGRTHCKENGVNLDNIVETSLHLSLIHISEPTRPY